MFVLLKLRAQLIMEVGYHRLRTTLSFELRFKGSEH